MLPKLFKCFRGNCASPYAAFLHKVCQGISPVHYELSTTVSIRNISIENLLNAQTFDFPEDIISAFY